MQANDVNIYCTRLHEKGQREGWLRFSLDHPAHISPISDGRHRLSASVGSHAGRGRSTAKRLSKPNEEAGSALCFTLKSAGVGEEEEEEVEVEEEAANRRVSHDVTHIKMFCHLGTSSRL